jgi:hypothetical protein
MRYYDWMLMDCGATETDVLDNVVNIFSSLPATLRNPVIIGDVRGKIILRHVKKLQRFQNLDRVL